MAEVADIIREIVGTTESLRDSWSGLSVIIGFDDDGDPDSSYGYAYYPDGIEAIAPAPWDLEEAINSYLGSVYGDGPFPRKMLIQFNRPSGRYNIEFEDKDPARWQVTPANIDKIREELRPKLD